MSGNVPGGNAKMTVMSHTGLTFCMRHKKELIFVVTRQVVCIPWSLKECMFEFVQLIVSILINSVPYQRSKLLLAACSFLFLFVCTSCLVTES